MVVGNIFSSSILQKEPYDDNLNEGKNEYLIWLPFLAEA